MGLMMFGNGPNWKQLKLGGGGFISGVDLHADGTKVIRADTTSPFIWNSATSTWQPLVTQNSMPPADAGVASLQGAYELRIAPSNSSRFYMVYNGYVFRSDNKGFSWRRTNFPQASSSNANANDGLRGDGPKIAVDPINADVLLVATLAGVSYSLDGGNSWTATSIPTPVGGTGSPGNGILVRYDPSSSTSGGMTQGVYATSFGNGLYHTTTGPNGTWSLVLSSPSVAFTSLVIAANGTVMTADDAATATPVIQRYVPGTGWSAISVGSSDQTRGLAVNPSNANQVWAVDSSGNISYSGDNGATFSGFGGGHTLTSTTIPWITYSETSNQLQPAATLIYDPSGSGLLYLGYGMGVAACTAPISATNVAWTDISQGIEQIISTRIIKPSGGQPIMAGWDQGVFRSPGFGSYPSNKGVTNNASGIAAAWDIDFCPTNPSVIIARIAFSNGAEYSGKSTDGGQTWAQFVSTSYQPGTNQGGMIACGTDPNNYVIVLTDNGSNANQPYYTTDGGSTWNAITISGVPTSGATGWGANYYDDNHTLCTDRVTADTFYIYNAGTQPGVYTSSNKGISWSRLTTTTFPNSGYAGHARMVSVPGEAGNLFFTAGRTVDTSQSSPQRSTTGGSSGSWSTISSLGETWCFGFGKASVTGSGYPAIFAVGYDSTNTIFGIRRSDDNATTWNFLPGSACPNGSLDIINDITGDPDVFGDCYICVRGSGFMYRKA